MQMQADAKIDIIPKLPAQD